MKKLWILIALMTVAMVLQVAGASGGVKDKLIFSHDLHKAAEVSCTSCHTDVATDKGIYKQLPAMSVCGECHEVKDKDQCSMCHTKPASAKKKCKKVRATNFLHSVHKDEIEDCSMCHADGSAPQNTGAHKTCAMCHEEDISNMLCAKCHRDFSNAGLKKVSGFSHKNKFLTEHSGFANKHSRTCTQCHRESFCTDCHGKKSGIKPSIKYPESVKRNFIHRGDWETRHQLEVKADSSSCLKCHAQKECSSCHLAKGASGSANDPTARHGSGWMSKQSRNFHGDKARRNITECASCHSAKGPGYCVDCHKGSLGINPHPPGWESKVNGLSKNSDRMCKTCHDK